MAGLAAFSLQPATEVGPRPGAATVRIGVRPALDRHRERRLFPASSCRRGRPSAGRGTRRAPEATAHQRVAQRLPLHPGEPRRLRPAHVVERVRDRVHPRRRPPVLLAPRLAPQSLRRQLISDLECFMPSPASGGERESRRAARAKHLLSQVDGSPVSGERCGILLRDGRDIRPFPLPTSSPGFTCLTSVQRHSPACAGSFSGLGSGVSIAANQRETSSPKRTGGPKSRRKSHPWARSRWPRSAGAILR